MYKFECEKVFNTIKEDWLKFQSELNTQKWVIGISGGKDSTVVATLASKIFSPENIVGISMPCNGQKDLDDVNQVFDVLKINRISVDIGEAYNVLLHKLENNNIEPSNNTKINLAPRLRMSTLYAVAQSVNGIVLNTDNLSEHILGYSTLWGDSVGDYAPIKNLTVTEVIKLGEWLGIPDNLIHKKPGDGLQPLGDEERMGIRYSFLDKLIRREIIKNLSDEEIEMIKRINDRFVKNYFKHTLINIPGPNFNYPNSYLGVE